jgi:cytochrome c biogenesis protein
MASAQSSTKLTQNAKAVEVAAMGGVNDAAVEEAASGVAENEKPRPGGGQKTSGVSGAIDTVLNLLSSVPFGIVLLMLLITACMIGMLIQQQELDTFPAYYAELTPAEKIVYGRLGFFDIYHAVYFNLLLLLLSLNIILASIDHFPAAWSFIARKKLTASPTFAMAQKFKEKVELPQLGRRQLVERAAAAARKTRFKVRVTEEDNRTTIFAERGVWNRLGAYVVHIGLLTIFVGGFRTSGGFTGMMEVRPNKSSDRMVQNVFNIDHANTRHAIGQRELELPFTIEGVDIQQKLINKDGSIDAGNTLDWLTRVRIVDHELGKTTEALIHMNNPFDYRDYRFFQASFNPLGSARTIKVKVTPANGSPEEITIQRNGEAKLSDGARVRYIEFNPHFVVGSDQKVTFGSTEYENPAAHLAYITPGGEQGEGWAFTQGGINRMSNAPFLKSKFLDTGAFQFVLTDFEKVPFAHTLSIQFDPGARIVYIGFTILCLALIGVFFFSHQRLWIVVEDGNVYLGGNSNRNRLGFEDRAKKLATLIREPGQAV